VCRERERERDSHLNIYKFLPECFKATEFVIKNRYINDSSSHNHHHHDNLGQLDCLMSPFLLGNTTERLLGGDPVRVFVGAESKTIHIKITTVYPKVSGLSR
jgi:hypothetical protein